MPLVFGLEEKLRSFESGEIHGSSGEFGGWSTSAESVQKIRRVISTRTGSLELTCIILHLAWQLVVRVVVLIGV